MTHTDQNPELLPCPFCGSSDSPMIMRMHGTASYQVLCDNCGASTGHSDRGDHIEEWNRRNYAIASNPAETAPADAGLQDCVVPTTEQSSGVGLPEPVAHINQNGVIHEAGYGWSSDNYLSGLYTEQQVRTLLAGVKESLTATGVPTATTGADCVTTGAAPMVQGCCIPIPAHSEYGSGIVTGKQVTLIFTNQGAAIAWMDGFCDAYDAANGTQSCSLPVPLPQPPKEQT